MARRKPDPALEGQMDMFGDWQIQQPPPPREELAPKGPTSAATPEPAITDTPTESGVVSLPLPANDVATPPERTRYERPGRPSAHKRELVYHGRPLGDLDARVLLRAPELSELLGLTLSTLAKLRCSGKGPPFYKLTNQTVGYRQDEVMDWLSHRRRVSTWTSEK
jgi:predicted DNA-binding transcriptional regulator AlpA